MWEERGSEEKLCDYVSIYIHYGPKRKKEKHGEMLH